MQPATWRRRPPRIWAPICRVPRECVRRGVFGVLQVGCQLSSFVHRPLAAVSLTGHDMFSLLWISVAAAPALNLTGNMKDRELHREICRSWDLPTNTTKAILLPLVRQHVGLAMPAEYVQPPRTLDASHGTAGCGLPATGGQYTLKVADPILGPIQRVYHLHVPTRYNKDAPTPLVIDFHAWGWDAESQLETSGVNQIADERTALVVYPEGYDDVVDPREEGSYSWNACGTTKWRNSTLGPTCQWIEDPSIPPADYPCHRSCQASVGCGQAGDEPVADGCDSSSCTDDTAFVMQLLDELEQNLCIDPRRIHATGMSNGTQSPLHSALSPPFPPVFLTSLVLARVRARVRACSLRRHNELRDSHRRFLQ